MIDAPASINLNAYVGRIGLVLPRSVPQTLWHELAKLCAGIENTNPFRVADLARVGHDQYGWPYGDIRDLLLQYHVHYTTKTLRNYASIARAYAMEERIYDPLRVTIHHYGVVAHLPHPVRHDLLTQVQNEGLSVTYLATRRDVLQLAAPPVEDEPQWSKATTLSTVYRHPILRELYLPDVSLSEPGWEGLLAYIPADKLAGLQEGRLQMRIEFFEVKDLT